jgi:hypothetical protein
MRPRRRRTAPVSVDPSLAAGYLAALPLFAAYEIGLFVLARSAARASAERVVGGILVLFGAELQLARIAVLIACAVLAWARVRRLGAPPELVRRIPRALGEGCAAGILLGPLLVLLQRVLDAPPMGALREPARTLPWLLRLIGAAPWEELLFRVGVYGLLFLAVRHASGFLGLETRAARFASELAALLGSALLFAAFHLDAVQRLLGFPGQPFHAGLFTWHVTAGILLGGLFRWRGFGAAAWAHALFNLGLALGIRA